MLSAAHFVSPPFSLHGLGFTYTTALCNLPDALNLPDGRIVTWYYPTVFSNGGLHFRSQQNPLINDAAGYYRFWPTIAPPSQLLHRRTGQYYQVGTWPVAFPNHAWHRFRLTWWSGSNLQGDHALVCRLESWVAGAWVNHGLLYDTADRYADAPQNGAGPYIYGAEAWVDDTQIWRPA